MAVSLGGRCWLIIRNRQIKIAHVFPGQGSQSVGMLSALAAREPVIEATFAEASDSLGYDLWQLVQEGPAEVLNSTIKTQPALLTASIALWRLWCAASAVRPALVAGHSLGEYSALVAAGVIDFADGVGLVSDRGRYMQDAVPENAGRMAAILGLDRDRVAAICRDAAGGQTVATANDNAPGQIVIAGDRAAVDRAVALARERGAKRAITLPVSVPSHCALMQTAADRLARRLDVLVLNQPKLTVLHNTDAASHDDIDTIRRVLQQQLCQPVRWVETVRRMADEKVNAIVECGPGRILSGLIKRIDKTIEVFSIDSPVALDETLATLGV